MGGTREAGSYTRDTGNYHPVEQIGLCCAVVHVSGWEQIGWLIRFQYFVGSWTPVEDKPELFEDGLPAASNVVRETQRSIPSTNRYRKNITRYGNDCGALHLGLNLGQRKVTCCTSSRKRFRRTTATAVEEVGASKQSEHRSPAAGVAMYQRLSTPSRQRPPQDSCGFYVPSNPWNLEIERQQRNLASRRGNAAAP